MPMSINFSEKALRFLTSPPPPAQPLSDIILTIKVSKDLNALAMIGRDLLRCCVRSRRYKPPIDPQFEVNVDDAISDRVLAKVARESVLLQRLKVDDVANDQADIAQIFCAYLGATFLCSLKEDGSNKIHESINDLCTMVLDNDSRQATDNNSHERMLNIPGLQRISTPIKQEPAPSYTSSTRAPSTVSHIFEDQSNESVSSGPNGPVHTSSPSILAQPQPQYNIQPPSMMPPQTTYPTQPPPGSMPPSGYPGMAMQPPNPGFAPASSAAAPAPVVASQQTQGFISLINELAMKNRRTITWQQAKVGQQHMPEWTMWLLIDGEIRGQGTAPTKQAAKEFASKAALQSLGWIQA
ncbi:hypothetical protein RSOLAG1IB_08257 [Rhizoctonia solani AG-1 IB]|uniref:DRBM domain-containing protein n=1 Tax=Thanatephorus cucumeris (strain AG1-IB / isolate 7/3/14) TaxID=1108050 RepID=A0A0B7FJC3_THACB|nr:hypothetical protein RSOLAG1IB_08257 [Rhizoctonia solani AG-1 IB]